MKRLLEDEGGFTLTELLVAITLFVVVLGGVLLTFNQFEVTTKLANERNDSQERARAQLDLLARELRGLASPTQEQPQAVDKATAYDMVFQTVDSTAPASGSLNVMNVRRVRYCLDNSDPANEVLWQQWQTWTAATAPSSPATASCPDGAWGTANRRQVTANVTNRIGGQDRPLFAFNSAVATDITSVHADLYIDLTPVGNPTETHLSSGVFLRNQNRKPTAAFEARPTGNGHVVLNGSSSEDPEGSPVTYQWFDQGNPTAIGTGITCDCVVGGSGTRTRTITLKVFDPAGLEGDVTVSVGGIT